MNLVLLGLPGAGKGTQAKHLSSLFNFYHLSTGDIFRKAIENETELGKKAKEYTSSGNLVPDEITIGLIKEEIKRIQDKDYEGIIFDGFPRTKNQAQALTEVLQEFGQKVDLCIYIKVAIEELIVRLSGRRICEDCGAIFHLEFNPPQQEGICDRCGGNLYQREDDNEEVVKNRIKENKKQMMELLSYYEKKGILEKVVGTGKMPEDVKQKTPRVVKEYK
ncbi:MAG: adenylate kinase [Halanaerobiaceae bacterium]